MKVLAQLSKMIFDLIVPRNEGSGGSNEILVGVGSKVWEWSFKVALHVSIMFHELQISYKLLTLFCWLILILGEEGWDWANKVGGYVKFCGKSVLFTEYYWGYSILADIKQWLSVARLCVDGPKAHRKWQKGYKIHEGTLCPRGNGGGSIHGSRMCHGNAKEVNVLRA